MAAKINLQVKQAYMNRIQLNVRCLFQYLQKNVHSIGAFTWRNLTQFIILTVFVFVVSPIFLGWGSINVFRTCLNKNENMLRC